MKKLLFIFSLLPWLLPAQTESDFCLRVKKMKEAIARFHVSPPDFNSSATNEEILELFLQSVDPNKRYFLAADITSLKEIVSPSTGEVFCSLYSTAWPLYKLRLHQADSIVTLIASKPLDFTAKDTIRFYSPNINYPSTLNESATRFKKNIKYRVLEKVLIPKYEDDELAKKSPADLTTGEAAARKSITARQLKYYKALLTGDERIKEKISTAISNAITHRCDPHSDFFSLKDKNNFEGSFSTQKLSFGFSVAENKDGNIEIAHLTPGSPAFKCNELHEEDVIIRLKFGSGDWVDVSDMDEEDFDALMESSTSNRLGLTVRRKDNSVKVVMLEKAKIETEENVLNSYILKEGNTSFGYIPLPSFYTDFESDEGLGCANDVAKEILKLKAENVEGIILDLRFNGGGSMKEAMNLAGIFIDEGPLAIYKQKTGKPTVLKDLNRGSLYDGPLLVMTNNYSASASEFFSAAIQDYNRGLIVGAKTYGKATAQAIFPVDTMLLYSRSAEFSPLGYIKLTRARFYRVKGSTHQQKGIVPDIELKDMLEEVAQTEAAEKFSLSPDSANKRVVFSPSPSLPVEALKAKSSQRFGQANVYKNTLLLNEKIRKLYKKEVIMPLEFNAVKKYYADLENLTKELEGAATDTLSGLIAENNNYSKEVLAFNEYKKEQNEKLKKTIQQDPYIKESFMILKDLNIFNKK